MVAYLGTRDIRRPSVWLSMTPMQKLVLEAMVYQIAKGIGEMSTVLDGDIDSIILTAAWHTPTS